MPRDSFGRKTGGRNNDVKRFHVKATERERVEGREQFLYAGRAGNALQKRGAYGPQEVRSSGSAVLSTKEENTGASGQRPCITATVLLGAPQGVKVIVRNVPLAC